MFLTARIGGLKNDFVVVLGTFAQKMVLIKEFALVTILVTN